MEKKEFILLSLSLTDFQRWIYLELPHINQTPLFSISTP
ncbi:unnamed protein product, partial [Arabidopsis halleri]